MRMTPARLIRALLGAIAAVLIVVATLWLQLRFGFGAELLGQPRANSPTLMYTPVLFAFESLRAAWPLIVPMAVLSALSGPWPIRAITLVVLAGGWYWAADRLALGFAADFNAFWLPGEAFSEALFDPVLTPALMLGAILAQAVVLKWINRQPT